MNGGLKYDGRGEDGSELKLRWDLLPLEAVEEIVRVYTYGSVKYSENTWQEVDPERYVAALMRHFAAYRSGERVDPESGLTHLAHVGWNVLALIWNDLNSISRKITDKG